MVLSILQICRMAGSRVLPYKAVFRVTALLSRLILVVTILIFIQACMKVGPDFVRPKTAVLSDWLESQDARLTAQSADFREWWQVFKEPVLDRLIRTAYQQNLNVRIAGVRVLEARAQLAFAVGGLYPQNQYVFGNFQYNQSSRNSALAGSSAPLKYEQAQFGLAASWELDFWGKFRRNIESAEATLAMTLADYDSALVSLTASVANAYILITALEKRIDIAKQSVETQTEALRIAEARVEAGTTSQRDVEQAKTLLNNTMASIPTLQVQEAQAKNALSLLLGLPPGNLTELLKGSGGIPVPPPRIAIGIPTDLLRRRPDIRSAEYQAIAQGALIGVAKADLFPAFSLNGTFSFLATSAGSSRISNIFQWASRNYLAGPGVQWNIFNYGRLENNVRVQDARFQQLLLNYQNTVLKAQQEVEDGLAAFLKGQERAQFLAKSAEAARQSLEFAFAQYREGIADFTVVLTAQQALLNEQDSLTSTLGDISASLVGIYRALGGGWQMQEGMEVVPADIRETMGRRTDWGGLLDPPPFPPGDGENNPGNH